MYPTAVATIMLTPTTRSALSAAPTAPPVLLQLLLVSPVTPAPIFTCKPASHPVLSTTSSQTLPPIAVILVHPPVLPAPLPFLTVPPATTHFSSTYKTTSVSQSAPTTIF